MDGKSAGRGRLSLTLLLMVFFSACSNVPWLEREPPEDFYDEDLHGRARGVDMLGYLRGVFDPRVHPDMVKVDRVYASKDLYLHRDAYDAFRRMHEAARRDGVRLLIVSGLRTFDYQKFIWNKKWHDLESSGAGNVKRIDIARKILRFSAMPAASRHHWGTDVDLNTVDNAWFSYGEGARVYAWLLRNASAFGFCQAYTAPDASTPPRTGYAEERWHWSFRPVSSELLVQYEQEVRDEQINGFDGDDLVSALRIREQYVAGISRSCLDFAGWDS